jgi:hypothetical protein
MGDEHAGELPSAKPTSTFEIVNVPRHPNSANCGSVFGGPMPSHIDDTEMIWRLEGTVPRLWAQAVEQSTVVPTAAIAATDMMRLIDITVVEE